jgi:alcohol dehydrogenase class IV
VIEPFTWRDGERVIHFGHPPTPDLLGGPGYTLLTTRRAAAQLTDMVEGAGALHIVSPGRVDEIAAALRPEITGELLVALGGGRVIDTAKALASADPPRRVAAIPTTLSGAEMTAVHRRPTGVPMDSPPIRPAIVVNDPEVCASQPPAELARSAGNALGHAAEGPLTPLRNPVATLAALESIRLLGDGLRDAADPDRPALALGALLAGYVIGSTGYGLHHVMSQTLVRFAGAGHGEANSILLPHTIDALARRFPDEVARLDARALAVRIAEQTGATRLREIDVSEEALERCAEEAATRPELHLTPPAANRDELLEIYRAAW